VEYDTNPGARDKWATIGTFYRVEEIKFAGGKTESLGKVALGHDGDLLIA
jgi:hypothetical protein